MAGLTCDKWRARFTSSTLNAGLAYLRWQGICFVSVMLYVRYPSEAVVLLILAPTCAVPPQVRQAVAIYVPMGNPLASPTTMRVKYSNPDVLLGPNTVDLPVSKAPVRLEFFYAPLKAGQSTGSIMLVNDEVRKLSNNRMTLCRAGVWRSAWKAAFCTLARSLCATTACFNLSPHSWVSSGSSSS